MHINTHQVCAPIYKFVIALPHSQWFSVRIDILSLVYFWDSQDRNVYVYGCVVHIYLIQKKNIKTDILPEFALSVCMRACLLCITRADNMQTNCHVHLDGIANRYDLHTFEYIMRFNPRRIVIAVKHLNYVIGTTICAYQIRNKFTQFHIGIHFLDNISFTKHSTQDVRLYC